MARHLHRKDNAWATEHCVRQIYAMLGIKGVTPTFKTTRTAKGRYRKYPYLLRDRKIRYANEVWATDIAYIKLLGSTMYFTAIIDLRSRKILSWRLSRNTESLPYSTRTAEANTLRMHSPGSLRKTESR